MMTKHTTSSLAAKIRQSFAAREYPGDDKLVEGNIEQDQEIAEIVAAFRSRHWNECTPQLLFSQNSALSFFTPDAFRYYLPAFMLGCLQDPITMDVAGDSVIFHLTDPSFDTGNPGIFSEEFSIEESGLPAEIKELLEGAKQVYNLLMGQDKDIYNAYAQARFNDIVSGFSSQEKIVIREFLEFLRDTYKEETEVWALESYWKDA